MSPREQEIFRQIIEYGKQYHVGKIVLFGSRARRSHDEKSDIDLAVYDCAEFEQFFIDIQENVWTLLEFDIVNMDEDVSDILRREIEQDGVILYEKI